MARTAQARQSEQLPLRSTWTRPHRPQPEFHRRRKPLCAGCREREARYGFQDPDDPLLERPRTLCFECFRVEIARRQEAAQVVQVRLPLEETLDALNLRRRRAQIAARRALAVSGF